MAEDVGGDRFGLFAAADQLHAALRGDVLDGSLAAAAGVDLGLDDRHRPGQLDEGIRRGLGSVGDEPAGHGHACLAEDLLGLEFVNFHGTGSCEEVTGLLSPNFPKFSTGGAVKVYGKIFRQTGIIVARASSPWRISRATRQRRVGSPCRALVKGIR